MKITVLNARDLTPFHWDRWAELQAENPDLDSPYFSPDFTRIVGAVREDVFVALLGRRQDPDAFFSFQRGRMGFGQPAGSRLSDLHGLVSARDFTVPAPELIRACGLSSWDFHAVPASQSSFVPHHREVVRSHYLDASGGAPGYEEARRRAGSDQPRRLRSWRRKAQERFKKVEFVPHAADARVLETLLEWKSKQYRDTGTMDNWSVEWMADLIRRLHAHRNGDFAGMLSALYFDGELAAAHLGIRSRTVWHWWIASYAEGFSEWRPGLLLLHHMIEQSPQFGVRRIDLGYGDEEYKLRMSSGDFPVARGRVEIPSVSVSLRRCREGLESWVRRSPLLPVLRWPGRLIKGVEKWNRYR